IEGKGMVVYPGLIDAGSDVALPVGSTPPAAPPRGGRTRTAPAAPATATAAAEPASNMNSYVRAADLITDGGARAEAARNAGITTALILPPRGIFLGQSALVDLNGDRATMVVRSTVAMHLRLSSAGGFRDYPGSLMGILAYVRQSFLDARRYREAWDVYRAHSRELRRPE